MSYKNRVAFFVAKKLPRGCKISCQMDAKQALERMAAYQNAANSLGFHAFAPYRAECIFACLEIGNGFAYRFLIRSGGGLRLCSWKYPGEWVADDVFDDSQDVRQLVAALNEFEKQNQFNA